MVGRALVVAVMLLGCDKAGEAKQEGNSKLPVVKLLDAGTGAKHKLRLHATAGATRTVVMKMRMSMEMDAGPALRIPRTELPIMLMTMDTKVTNVDKAGAATYALVVSKIDVEPGNAAPNVVEGVRGSVGKLTGMKGTATVDTRNFTVSGNFDVPAGADANTKQMLDSMSQSISQLSAPLPEEEVGVGAKWSVDATMPANGIVLKQKGIYEITKLDGDHFSAKLTIDQTADAQDAHPPGMGGATLSVVSWKGKGNGDIELDLAKEILPVHAAVTVSENAKFLIKAGGEKQEMTMGLDLGMDL